jgi:hypothetical protein
MYSIVLLLSKLIKSIAKRWFVFARRIDSLGEAVGPEKSR